MINQQLKAVATEERTVAETPAEREARRREILRRCAEAWGIPRPVPFRYRTPDEGDSWSGLCVYGDPHVYLHCDFIDSDQRWSERAGREKTFLYVYVHECAHWLLNVHAGVWGHAVEFAGLNVWLGLQLPEEAWEAAGVRTPGTWIAHDKEDFYCVSEELGDLTALRDKAICWAVELHREHPGLTAPQAARLLAARETEECWARAAQEQRRQAAWDAVGMLAVLALVIGAGAAILCSILFPFSFSSF